MKFVYSLLFVLLITALTGCRPSEPSIEDASSQASSPADHDDHGHGAHDEVGGNDHGASDHPDSLDEAVEHISKIGSKITDAFSRRAADDVHDELHEIGHLIESLPELATTTGLSADEQETVKEATEALMDAFGVLDGTLHGGDDADFDEVNQAIASQLESLRSLL